jgi:hypothetical protein
MFTKKESKKSISTKKAKISKSSASITAKGFEKFNKAKLVYLARKADTSPKPSCFDNKLAVIKILETNKVPVPKDIVIEAVKK